MAENLIPPMTTTYNIWVPTYDLGIIDQFSEATLVIQRDTVPEVQDVVKEILVNWAETKLAKTRRPQEFIDKHFGFVGYVSGPPTVHSVTTIDVPLKDIGF